MYRYHGLGAGIKAAEKARFAVEERASSLRRIAEAEAQQKQATEEAEEFQGQVVSWLPKIGLGVALVVGAFAWWRLSKKGKG